MTEGRITMTVTRARIFEAVATSPVTAIHVAEGVRLLQTGCGLGAAPGNAASVTLLGVSNGWCAGASTAKALMRYSLANNDTLDQMSPAARS